jgi:hypothetical protein
MTAVQLGARRKWVVGLVALALFGVVAFAQLLGAATPSDGRAQFVAGNVTSCAAAGFGSSIQVGSPSNTGASDANNAGMVATNAGLTQPGQGQEVAVTITGANVIIDAVVVKGGPAYNVYSDPAFLPPTLTAPQHYISPFNNGGNVPDISHWFVCYHMASTSQVGSLSVDKSVIAPEGVPVTPLPQTFTARVNCNDGDPAHQNGVVSSAPAVDKPRKPSLISRSGRSAPSSNRTPARSPRARLSVTHPPAPTTRVSRSATPPG